MPLYAQVNARSSRADWQIVVKMELMVALPDTRASASLGPTKQIGVTESGELMSSVGISKYCGIGVVTVAATLGALAFTASPARASGWNVDHGSVASRSDGSWALTYGTLLHGMAFGFGACNGGAFYSNLGGGIFYCYGWDGTKNGYGQVVRNNAHSIASLACYGATTWVYANAVGNYNWVHAHKYGTLNSHLANNENSAGNGNSC